MRTNGQEAAISFSRSGVPSKKHALCERCACECAQHAAVKIMNCRSFSKLVKPLFLGEAISK